MTGYQGSNTASDQSPEVYVAKQPSGTLISTPTAFIAELDSTPIEPKKVPLPLSSTPSKAPACGATVMVLGAREQDDYKDYEILAGRKPAVAHLLQEASKAKVAKMKDPAVLVDLPTSPSAQAYEIVQQSKDTRNGGYFDPVYVDTEDSPLEGNTS